MTSPRATSTAAISASAPPTDSNRRRSLLRFWLPVLALLSIQAALGISAAAQLTPTHDEYWHLPIGLLNLKTGRFDFDDLNPPLCRMLAALPLTLTSAQTGDVSQYHDPQGWGDVFIAENREHYQRWFTLGRSMIVLLSALGGLALALWARELFGDGAGVLAALFWACEPNLIAHGSLVTTDMGAAAFFVFALYAAWRFARRPSWGRGLLCGGLLGLAQLAKFTALVLYPIVLVFVLVVLFDSRAEADPSTSPGSSPSRQRPGALKVVGIWVAALALSVVVWNAGYLGRGSFATASSYNFQSRALKRMVARWPLLGRLPLPVPRDYVSGLDHQRQIMEQKHPVYLDGQWSEDGFPGYYIWALFYKLPHALQLLDLLVLLWLVMPAGQPRRWATQAVILLPALVVLVVAETSPMQLGIRYVLPVIPFAILFASQAAQWLDWRQFPARCLATTVLAAAMLLSVRYHPEHLSYFNELAGGPLGGREHLLDSNLDWGQDLGGLQKYLAQQTNGQDVNGRLGKNGEIGLAYFGTVPPSALGIRYHLPPGNLPQPGRYAVSVNFEQGRPHWVRTPAGAIQLVNIDQFAYFGFFQPIARIGYSIDVFDLSERDVADWRKQRAEALRR